MTRALVAYSASSTFVQTTLDYLNAFKKYSGYDTNYVHVTHDAKIEFDFDAYDVIFHNYCARLCFDGYVCADYRERMRRFRGVKILAVQDEYDHTDKLKAAIRDLGFDIVLTCVPQDSLDYVYPQNEFPGVTFLTVFTGYVSDDFASNHPVPVPLAERPIMIGYRGRDIGGKYGRLGFDKFEIGRRMKEICVERGIAHDIAMDEESRIYGMAWFEFLGSCRAMLGTESGSNVFDFDSSLDAKFKEMTAANGGVPPSYAQFLPMVAQRDSEISMGQISPRVFECALMHTPMLLFRGHYSGAIQPDEHYIALEKDFSNIDDVLSRLEDLPGLAAMTQRAYAHLVGSGQFNYRSFFGRVGDEARRHGAGRAPAARPEFVASEAAFLLRGAQAIELPSTIPDNADGLKLRVNMATFETLSPEISRLEKEFVRHSGNCNAWIQELVSSGQSLHASMCETFAAYGEFDRIQISPADTSALDAFMATARAQDAEWEADYAEVAKLIAAAGEGAPILPSSYRELLAAPAGVIARYQQLSARFAHYGSLYDSTRQSLENRLEAVYSSAIRLAWSNIRKGQHIRPMARFIGRHYSRRAVYSVKKTLRNLVFAALRLIRRLSHAVLRRLGLLESVQAMLRRLGLLDFVRRHFTAVE